MIVSGLIDRLLLNCVDVFLKFATPLVLAHTPPQTPTITNSVEARTGKTNKVAGNVAGLWELRLQTAEPRMRPCYVLYCGEKGFSLWLPSLR